MSIKSHFIGNFEFYSKDWCIFARLIVLDFYLFNIFIKTMTVS